MHPIPCLKKFKETEVYLIKLKYQKTEDQNLQQGEPKSSPQQ